MVAIRGRASELWIAALIVIFDQATKALVRAKLPLHDSVTVIPGFFDLTHVRNTGAAFGMLNTIEFAYKPLVMVLVALVALGAVAAYAFTLPPSQRVARFGLALILGGAVGNLIDRATTGFVVDFVDVYWRGLHFWAFNVADSAITVGVVLMLLDMLGVGRVPRLFEIPEIFGIGPLTIYTYGVMLAAAYLLGLQLAIVRSRKAGLDSGRMLDLGVYIVIAALIGAKLLLLLVNFNYFRNNPNEILVLARSGGVFYGGLITATLVAFWYIRRHKLPFWTTCDMFAPGIALGHVIGRLGCLMAGCCYGKPASVPWAITFTDPFAAANVGTPLNVPLHPTQLYEAGAELIILIFLLVTERKGRPYPGRTFWGYMFLYALSRFVIEFYRADERGFIMGLSTSQFISLMLAPLSLIMLVYLGRRFSPEPAKAARRAA